MYYYVLEDTHAYPCVTAPVELHRITESTPYEEEKGLVQTDS